MKRVLVCKGDPEVIVSDLRKIFGFKVTKVMPCDVAQAEMLEPGIAVTYKASKKKYAKFLETRERYGF